MEPSEDSILVEPHYSVPNLNHREFRAKYRMSRHNFDSLLDLIKDHPVFSPDNNKPRKYGPHQSCKNQVLTLLHFLGQEGCTSRTTRNVFHIGQGTHYLYMERAVEAICSLRKVTVAWPDKEERKAIC